MRSAWRPSSKQRSSSAATVGRVDFVKSTNCGSTCSPSVPIASTRTFFDVGIPAQCRRRVLVYPVLGVDRSSGPRRGSTYAVWMDAP